MVMAMWSKCGTAQAERTYYLSGMKGIADFFVLDDVNTFADSEASGWDYMFIFEFGLNVLKQYGVVKQTDKGWEFTPFD